MMTMMFKVLLISVASPIVLAYYPPKKDSVLASAYTGGGYGNVPAAVDYGLTSIAPQIQVTYGSINKVHAEVKQKSLTASSSYGVVPEQGNVVREEKQVKQPPSLSYAGYGQTEAEVKQPESKVVKAETPNVEAPKQPYGGSYGANVEAESRMTERVITKQTSTQSPVTPKMPVVPGSSSYGSIYGGVETKDQNVKETKFKVQPPPMTNYGAYGSVGSNTVEENVKQQPTTLPPPPPPSASNFGNIITGYGQPVKEVQATTVFVTQPTSRPVTIPSSYDQYIAPKKDSVAAKLPTGYGIVPESAGSSIETKQISEQVQPLPSSYGSLVQWKKDQVAKENNVNQQQETAEKSRDLAGDKDISSSSAVPTTAATFKQSTPASASAEDDNEIKEATASPAPPMPDCVDKNEYCDYWKEKNECEQNPAYMRVNCPVACGTCKFQRKYLMTQELQS